MIRDRNYEDRLKKILFWIKKKRERMSEFIKANSTIHEMAKYLEYHRI